MMFQKVAVLGVGLIGGSFALAMKKNGLCKEITGFGRSEKNLAKARERGMIDSFALEPAAACNGAELIFFATPVGSFVELARRTAPSMAKGAIVTDAGSVKGGLVYQMEKAMPEGVHYIGAHPIAGSDRSGIDSSDAGLFRDAKCIVTPTEDSDQRALETVTGVWKSLGAQVVTMGPDLHDRIYAFVSHLPHLLAYALVNSVSAEDGSYFEFSGQGFKDVTRIASSSPELWRDICLLNRENLLETISLFQKNLDSLSQYLRAGDAGSLEREFVKARQLREGLGQD
jgi:prephenate dehydrogenase